MLMFYFEVKNVYIEVNGNLYWYGILLIFLDMINDLIGFMYFNIYNGK